MCESAPQNLDGLSPSLVSRRHSALACSRRCAAASCFCASRMGAHASCHFLRMVSASFLAALVMRPVVLVSRPITCSSAVSTCSVNASPIISFSFLTHADRPRTISIMLIPSQGFPRMLSATWNSFISMRGISAFLKNSYRMLFDGAGSKRSKYTSTSFISSASEACSSRACALPGRDAALPGRAPPASASMRRSLSSMSVRRRSVRGVSAAEPVLSTRLDRAVSGFVRSCSSSTFFRILSMWSLPCCLASSSAAALCSDSLVHHFPRPPKHSSSPMAVSAYAVLEPTLTMATCCPHSAAGAGLTVSPYHGSVLSSPAPAPRPRDRPVAAMPARDPDRIVLRERAVAPP